MVRRFQVAGLDFSLDMPDAHPAGDHLHNYDPFETSRPGALLFELELSAERLEETGEVMFESPEEDGEPVVGFYRRGSGYLAKFAPWPKAPVCGWLELDGDFKHGRLFAEGRVSDQVFAINNALMLLFAFASAPFRTLEMHASVVMNGGRGFLFLGRSGSTTTTPCCASWTARPASTAPPGAARRPATRRRTSPSGPSSGFARRRKTGSPASTWWAPTPP